MKAWQKGFLSGMFLGGLVAGPAIWWFSKIRVGFHCPQCDATLAIEKEGGEIAPRIALQQPSSAVLETREEEEPIAVAPTL